MCSFLNRFGGDIYLGVEDNGEVCGVPQNAAPEMVKNFIKMVSNPEIINPTVYLVPEIIEYEGKQIVHIHVPPSSEVHSYKRTIYDRVDDADIKVTATGQIALLYIRKQNIFTEKRIYPYVRESDLRFDLLPKIRQMAINRYSGHPWKNLNDTQLLQSAGLYGEDKATGDRGYNLAAIMLLGRDETIRSVVPAYRTDALLRKVNVDRYDDRLLVTTNLTDSYELLMGFAEKHLWDKFYLEGDVRISLRNAIAREMLVNTLIHREFTSPYIAKFVIEKNRMYVENANRAVKDGAVTLEDYEPNPKMICSPQSRQWKNKNTVYFWGDIFVDTSIENTTGTKVFSCKVYIEWGEKHQRCSPRAWGWPQYSPRLASILQRAGRSGTIRVPKQRALPCFIEAVSGQGLFIGRWFSCGNVSKIWHPVGVTAAEMAESV